MARLARVNSCSAAFFLALRMRVAVFPVCGNTWRMLADTRFAPHFDFIGDFSSHYGIFPGCGTSIPFASGEAPKASSEGCC